MAVGSRLFTLPGKLDNRELRRWRFLDLDQSESRIRIVEQLSPLFRSPLFSVQELFHP